MYNPITKKYFKAAVTAFAISALLLGTKNIQAQTRDAGNAWRLDFGVEPGVLLTSSEAYNHLP